MQGKRARCQRGHELTPENLYVWADGRKRCRQCRLERRRRQGIPKHPSPECCCASCLWSRVEDVESPEVTALRRNMHRGVVERGLQRVRERLEQSSEQSITPLGELVRREVEAIGERVRGSV